MRRFGRRRRSGGSSSDDGSAEAIDAGRWLQRIVEEGVVAAKALAPIEGPTAAAIPANYAAVGVGEAEDGSRLVVGFSPRSGGDAVLAALAAATYPGSNGEDAPASEVVAVAPEWSASARRRLSLVGELPFRFRAVTASNLAEGLWMISIASTLAAGTLSSPR